jgi:hypothetical protein
MKNIKYLSYLFFALFLMACEAEKEIDLPLPYPGDKFVIQGFVSQQEGIWAMISVTTNPNDKNDDSKVSNIKVLLFEDNIQIGELKEKTQGYFTIDNLAIKTGRKYHLSVEGMNLQKATTPQVLPIPLVKMKNIELIKKDSFQAVLNFQFKDEIGNNSYQVKVNQYENNKKWLSDNSFDEYFNAFEFFNDKNFEGKNKSYAQNVRLFKNDNNQFAFADEIEVKLYSFSPELKLFLESIFNAEGTGQSPSYNPIPVYNNINGGFGIFAAYSADIQKLKVE